VTNTHYSDAETQQLKDLPVYLLAKNEAVNVGCWM